jgi:LysM domain-containing protein
MLKKLPAVFVGLLLTLSVYAANVELNDSHPDSYTVQKGDTLWSISARFLKKPWLWPEVWQANAQIPNPHLIYPGDVISLAYVNGQPRLSAGTTQNSGLQPHVRATPLEKAVAPLPLDAIALFLHRPRIISKEEFETAPHVVGFEDGHIVGTPGNLAFVRGLDAQQGQHFAIVRVMGRYVEFTSKDPNQPNRIYRQSMENEYDRPSMLWHVGPQDFTLSGDVHFLGYEVLQFANVEVTHTGNPASVLVLDSEFEVREGDYIVPADPQPYDPEFVPRPPKTVPAGMQVIAFGGVANVGRLQVVATSFGAEDGIENGQVFSIFHAEDTVHDDTDYPAGSAKSFFHPSEGTVFLPRDYVGHLMVFRTFAHVSYALVMDGIRPVHVGDRLFEPDHR